MEENSGGITKRGKSVYNQSSDDYKGNFREYFQVVLMGCFQKSFYLDLYLDSKTPTAC
jgi:hypothetical protein